MEKAEKQVCNYESDLKTLNALNVNLISRFCQIQERLRQVNIEIGGFYLGYEVQTIKLPEDNYISVYEYALNSLTEVYTQIQIDLDRLEKLASK